MNKIESLLILSPLLLAPLLGSCGNGELTSAPAPVRIEEAAPDSSGQALEEEMKETDIELEKAKRQLDESEVLKF